MLQSALPVLLDVTAPWCPPCKLAVPVVGELAQKYAGRLKVVVIDGERATELVARLGVRGFPTFFGVRDGAIVARSAGFGSKRGLEAFAEQLLAPSSGSVHSS